MENMSTIQFRPEILVAGFAHVIWVLLLSLQLLGISPHNVVNFLYNIGPGLALILITSIFVISFFLGTLFEQVLIVTSYLFMNKERRESISVATKFSESNQALSIELARAWDAKSFFRSVFFAGLLTSILLLRFDVKLENGKHWIAIFIISVILESATLESWLFIKYRIREAK